MKLNLGCGLDKRREYLNCDKSKLVNPDRVIDLEKKLPFKNDSVDEILANHVLEHIVNFIPLMYELIRICKSGAIIKVKTPFYSAWGQFNDPTHVRFFSPKTFDYFNKGTYSHQVDSDKDLLKVKKVKINFAIGRAKVLNSIFNPLINLHQDFYCRFFAWILPASEIEYELIVK